MAASRHVHELQSTAAKSLHSVPALGSLRLNKTTTEAPWSFHLRRQHRRLGKQPLLRAFQDTPACKLIIL